MAFSVNLNCDKISNTNLYSFQANFGKTPLTYQKLCGIVSQIGPPPKPVDPVESLLEDSQLENSELVGDEKYNVPSLEELVTILKQFYSLKLGYLVHKMIE